MASVTCRVEPWTAEQRREAIESIRRESKAMTNAAVDGYR
jgi:hypothetical protein